MAPRLLDEGAAEVVAAHAAVPVGEAGAGRDDEGRVGDDQVEGLRADRLEEGALAEVGGGGAGEGEGEPGELQGAGVEVRRGDAGGVLGRVQRLDTGARTEVEGRGDRRTDGDGGEGGGGPADAEDDALLVRADPARTADRAAEVGDDEPVLAVRTAVRTYVDGGADQAVLDAHPAVLDALLQRQGGARLLLGDGALEEEQPHQRVERRPAPGGAQGGHGLAAGERGVGGCAEPVEESVGGEGGGEQRLAEAGGVVGCGKAGLTHPTIVSGPTDNGSGPGTHRVSGPPHRGCSRGPSGLLASPEEGLLCFLQGAGSRKPGATPSSPPRPRPRGSPRPLPAPRIPRGWRARSKAPASGSPSASTWRRRPHRTGASSAPGHRWC